MTSDQNKESSNTAGLYNLPDEHSTNDYMAHIAHLIQRINFELKSRQLPIEFSWKPNQSDPVAERRFNGSKNATGVLHDAQISTAVSAISRILEDPSSNGVIIGGTQAGKTTTCASLLFLGPISWLLSKNRFQAILVSPIQRSHEIQLRETTHRFLQYYGGLSIKNTEGTRTSILSYWSESDVGAELRSNTHNRTSDNTGIRLPTIDDFVFRKVHGRKIEHIANRIGHLIKHDIRPIIVCDEPQFGASDHVTMASDGSIVQKPCVTRRLLDRVNQVCGDDNKVPFIGVSATPFELAGLDNLWKVRHRLESNYQGLNFFDGRPLDSSTIVRRPNVLAIRSLFNSCSDETNNELFDFSKFKAAPETYEGTTYRLCVAKALRDRLIVLLRHRRKSSDWGVCIRALNSNSATASLIRLMRLHHFGFEVLTYYGPNIRGITVEEMIENRTQRHLPFVVFVTSRGRMADAFPPSVLLFVDFSKKASNLNALLQGLIGRACGYNKRTLVLVSERNKEIYDNYVAKKGQVKYPVSRHAIRIRDHTTLIRKKFRVIQPYERGAPTLFQKLERAVLDPIRKRPSEQLKDAFHKPAKARRGPILSIAHKCGLFEHTDQSSAPPMSLKDDLFTLRDSDAGVTRAGEFSESNDESKSNPRIQFSLARKREPKSNGDYEWRITSIAIPTSLLKRCGLKDRSGTERSKFLPISACPYSRWMTGMERVLSTNA